MELADGSLDERLKAAQASGRPGLNQAEIRQVMFDAAAALDFLNHEHGILHRDVKPANMLLLAHRLKLCDFGLARMSENLAIAAGRTTLSAGTPAVIAPEIINGFQSKHSDQYSLAVTYFILRCGRPLFQGRVDEIRRHHLNTPPPLGDTRLTPAEALALERALRKRPDDRFPSSAAFVQALMESSENYTFSNRPGSGAVAAESATKTPIAINKNGPAGDAAKAVVPAQDATGFDPAGVPEATNFAATPVAQTPVPLPSAAPPAVTEVVDAAVAARAAREPNGPAPSTLMPSAGRDAVPRPVAIGILHSPSRTLSDSCACSNRPEVLAEPRGPMTVSAIYIEVGTRTGFELAICRIVPLRVAWRVGRIGGAAQQSGLLPMSQLVLGLLAVGGMSCSSGVRECRSARSSASDVRAHDSRRTGSCPGRDTRTAGDPDR